MTYSITRTYRFEAAHFLPKVPATHKCKRVHGHNYRADVTVSGRLNDCGFVIDFFDLDAEVQPIIDRFDHRILNDVKGLENPTAEIIAQYIASELDVVARVRVYETDDAYAEYSAP